MFFMKYFTLVELTKSQTANRLKINNVPNENQKQNLINLVENILDPLREAYGYPIIVSSGFRNEKLNNVVGGAKNSQHTTGQAADIHTVSDTVSDNKKIFDLIISLNLPFDQLIDEYNYNWIHVSFGPRNRKQILHIK